MNLPRDLAAMLSAFEKRGVRYLVVGGHAVSLHARPRSTKDLDLWLDANATNVARACVALADFGLPSTLVEELRVAKPDEIIWIGRPPARVDFLLTLPGVTFTAAWSRRVTVDLAGVAVSVIGREDLIANKVAVGRPQDRRDVRALEKAAATASPAKRRRTRT